MSKSGLKSGLKSSTKSRRHRIILIGALLAVGNVASGCSAIDRLSQIGETPKLNAIENRVRTRTEPGARTARANRN